MSDLTGRKSWWEDYQVSVPEGKSGDWEVKRFTVNQEESKHDKLQAMFSFSSRYAESGEYTKLVRNQRTLVMSDTPDEIGDHLEFIRKANGSVLINGLGLGVALQGVLNKEEVQHVTVVELSEDVIALIAPHYYAMFGTDRLTVIHADALVWKPSKGVRFDIVWHDIWDTICEDNLSEMHTLHRRYGRRCNWQGSWARDILEDERRRNSTGWGY